MTRSPQWRQAQWETPTIFEKDRKEGHVGHFPVKHGKDLVPASLARDHVGIPTLPALDVVRHYTRLSQKNVGVDTSFYPLGSCTMKINPKLNDAVAGHPGAELVHPLLPDEDVQGALEMMFELQEVLKDVSGMDHVTLQPAAGAAGEWTAMLICKAYHEDRGEGHRTEVIVPDSAHGTNPASAAMVGYDVIEIPSNKSGGVDLDALKAALGPKTAAFMITNPSTIGVFEENIQEIAKLVHDAGALLYYDGANLNAIMGITSPGTMGFDFVHFNLHKTFTVPHGGGGPGAGPIGIKAHLAPYLPVPVIEKNPDGTFRRNYDRPKSIGKVKGFYGNFGNLVRAYTYARCLGSNGLTLASKRAVLNANYMRVKLAGKHGLEMPFRELRKHEFVLSATRTKKEKGIRALDIAKRLLDYGYHAPTVYFPHIVDEGIMIEPTETESKETMDRFIDAMEHILTEDPEVVKTAPHNTAVGRVDEVYAVKHPRLTYDMKPSGKGA
ncbi:MAG TPA: aminomethyl-transferring glycine dehydrogenase subunit GcvPB [Candidatus Thermoplasmatota archaeon]|nr:aminomethyl-transferring glycine dehydrogenase subunit GcvPB [Candidatus Thermoplasmatota archaeon]